MNIEEARNVLWLKSNPRPLGELLDEGYLTKDRLEWAAGWAYNSKLKQAAKVILQSILYNPTAPEVEEKPAEPKMQVKDEGMEVPLSLEAARAILWPFPPSTCKGKPMGPLVESKQLSLKELGYAIENAWDPAVRQAATLLALVRLNQAVREPAPRAGFARVVSGGRSFSQRRESALALIQGVMFGLLIAVGIYFLVVRLASGVRSGPNIKTLAELVSTPGGVIGLVIVLGCVLLIDWLANFAINKVTNRLDQKIENYRRGQEGEEQVLQSILQALDGDWHVFRNLSLPGRNQGDLDLVLVGPPGLWALEVKDFNGRYRNVGEDWQCLNSKGWRNLAKNPGRQAKNNAARLAHFLRADHLKVFVNPVVVWANPESPLFIENPSVAVWCYNQLAEELGNIWQAEKLAETQRNKIVEKLTRLCERQQI